MSELGEAFDDVRCDEDALERAVLSLLPGEPDWSSIRNLLAVGSEVLQEGDGSKVNHTIVRKFASHPRDVIAVSGVIISTLVQRRLSDDELLDVGATIAFLLVRDAEIVERGMFELFWMNLFGVALRRDRAECSAWCCILSLLAINAPENGERKLQMCMAVGVLRTVLSLDDAVLKQKLLRHCESHRVVCTLWPFEDSLLDAMDS